jgi:glutamyl-tRNA synthetase
MIRVRFAPSPTGLLHLGNARMAVLNALFARHHGGIFVLRIDDTDTARCRPEYIQGIQDDLLWLGLHWDDMFAQSDRQEEHRSYFETLLKSGRIYPCFETAEQLDVLRKEQLSKRLPPVYDRTKGQSATPHDAPYWRFALMDKEVCWDDAIQGSMRCQARHLSDPVVMRQDGSMSYLLSSVIDDVHANMTHILRGADHLTNTTIQIQMMEALDKPIPVWAHFPLMLDGQGEKFSKRTGSKTLQELRSEGWFPLAIVQALTQLGLSRMVQGDFSEIASGFSLNEYSKSNAKFGIHDIEMNQSRLWAMTDWAHLSQPLQAQICPELWLIIRDNIVHESDIGHWQGICQDSALTFPPSLDTSVPMDFFKTALKTLESSGALVSALPTKVQPHDGDGADCMGDQDNIDGLVWADDPWHLWIDAMVTLFPDLKKGSLCRTLRAALTGCPKGPKMDQLLPMMAPHCVMARIRFESNNCF